MESTMADVMTVDTETIVLTDTVRLYLAVARLSRLLRRIGSRPTDLGDSRLSALSTLADHGPLRMSDLAAKEGVTQPTLSKIIASLVDGGFVRRTADPSDGRACLVTPTEESEPVVTRLYSARLAELRSRVDQLTPEQVRALVASLPVLEELVGHGDAPEEMSRDRRRPSHGD